MALLRVNLLGGVRFQLPSGADIMLQTRKGPLLLAYLALMPGRAQSRARLIELLWSDRSEAQARASLRQELHALRRGLAGVELPVLDVAGDTVALKANAIMVDVAAFERWVDRGDRDALERAAALYRGDLLEGVAPAGAAFEEWLAFERRRLRALAIDTLSRLLMLQMEDGVGEAAARTARTLLAWEETHEGARRALMLLLARRCEWNAALPQFQLCRAVVARELRVELDAETTQRDREMLCRAPGTPTEGQSRLWDSGGSGTSVTAPPIDASESGTRVSGGIAAPQTERRQLAVIFVDMVQSTALAARLDPEKLRDVLDSFHQATAEAVARFDGRVVERRGDAILACFGWPQAHEDDAERAVRAGLVAVEAIARQWASDTEPLACRVGVATGVVVVEEFDAGLEVWGETAHLAARLHALGPPGAVVLTEPTRRVLGQLFAYESLGRQLPEGFATPVDTWRVVGDGMVASRFEALRGSSLTPLVGRRQELALLLDRWRQASGGEGQVVLLSGEAGIGKSRLVRALRERLIDAPHTALGLFCSPHHGNTMLFPVLRLLERVAGLRRADPPERQLDMLEAMLALAGEHEPEVAPLLADLLEIADTGRYARPALTPARKKERTLRALLGQLTGLAARGPVLAVYDDVHWADPTTLELLQLVIDRVQQLPALVVITFRPEFVLPWTGYGHVIAMPLQRLGQRDGARMIEEVTGGKAVPEIVVSTILKRADGVPIFVEELTRAVLASPTLRDRGTRYELTGPVPDVAVPATLTGSLMAQLDRMALAREVSQVGAVIGRQFSQELLAAVETRPEAEWRLGLDQLLTAGLIHRAEQGGQPAFAFRHALVRDAAYESLLRRRRRELHRRIARTLHERFPAVVADEPESLAHHLTEAGLPDEAIDYWRRAAERAVGRYANAEAISHYHRALELLVGLPATAERDRTEMLLRMGLGVPLMASMGYSAPPVQQALGRARELSRSMADGPTLFPILFGLCAYYAVKPDFPAARPLAARCLAAARRARDQDLAMAACGVAGTLQLYQGRLLAAHALLSRGLALYQPGRYTGHAIRYGLEPISPLAFIARTEALLGRRDLALKWGQVLLGVTRDSAVQPNTLAALHAHLAQLHVLLRDPPAALGHAAQTIELATRHDLPLWLGLGRMYRGAALVAAGIEAGDGEQVDEGIATGLEGMAAYRATGAGLDVPTCLCWYAAGHGKRGRPAAALSLLAQALELIATTDEAYFAAEAHRLVAEQKLCLDAYDPSAEASLRRSLAIARRQRAQLFARRAGAALARQWRGQGRQVQARALLATLHPPPIDDGTQRSSGQVPSR